MLISHNTDAIQVYSVTVMTHVKALQAGHSSQGTSEPITPELLFFEENKIKYLFLFFLGGFFVFDIFFTNNREYNPIHCNNGLLLKFYLGTFL